MFIFRNECSTSTRNEVNEWLAVRRISRRLETTTIPESYEDRLICNGTTAIFFCQDIMNNNVIFSFENLAKMEVHNKHIPVCTGKYVNTGTCFAAAYSYIQYMLVKSRYITKRKASSWFNLNALQIVEHNKNFFQPLQH